MPGPSLQPPRTLSPRRAVSTVQAVAATFALHAAIGVALASILYRAEPPATFETSIADWQADADLEQVVVLPKIGSAPGEDHPAGGSAQQPVVAVSSAAAPAAVGRESLLSDAAPAPPSPEVPATDSGSGSARGVGSGSGTPTRFFDAGVESRRIVYVVDASGSMRQAHPGPMKTRIGRVKEELIDSVLSLRPEQKFFVIFFNDEAYPMPGRQLIAGGKSPLSMRYLRWAAATKPGGKTDPEPALRLALSLQPDTIFFLTDGSFKPIVVERTLAANDRRTPIHTVAIGEADAEPMLVALAEGSGGTYTFVPRNPDGSATTERELQDRDRRSKRRDAVRDVLGSLGD